jgi:hypothetical protein
MREAEEIKEEVVTTYYNASKLAFLLGQLRCTIFIVRLFI